MGLVNEIDPTEQIWVLQVFVYDKDPESYFRFSIVML